MRGAGLLKQFFPRCPGRPQKPHLESDGCAEPPLGAALGGAVTGTFLVGGALAFLRSSARMNLVVASSQVRRSSFLVILRLVSSSLCKSYAAFQRMAIFLLSEKIQPTSLSVDIKG